MEFKDNIKKELENKKFIYDMASKIQAWWRGVMVRRGLGQFKKKKKVVQTKK